VVNRDIQVKHISTQEQIADVFTKNHSTTRFSFLRSKGEDLTTANRSEEDSKDSASTTE
jgi:hypothetical protein